MQPSTRKWLCQSLILNCLRQSHENQLETKIVNIDFSRLFPSISILFWNLSRRAEIVMLGRIFVLFPDLRFLKSKVVVVIWFVLKTLFSTIFYQDLKKFESNHDRKAVYFNLGPRNPEVPIITPGGSL